MAPKAKPKARKDLTKPIVSQSELEHAKKLLEDAEELKRARSNMTYYLRSIGLEGHYAQRNSAAKKEYLELWFADRLNMREAKLKSSSTKEFTNTTRASDDFFWASKQELINLLGEIKANNKINSGKLESRPDRDTGLTGEWDLEYKLNRDTGGSEEAHKRGDKLSADIDDMDEDAAKKLSENLDSAGSCMASSSCAPMVPVKKEVENKPNGEVSMPYADELKRLESDLKKEMRTFGDRLLTLKELFEGSKDNKYFAQVNDDCSKLLPKAGGILKKLEKAHLEGSSEQAVLLVIAKSIHEFQQDFDELMMWWGRLNPSKGTKKAKKS